MKGRENAVAFPRRPSPGNITDKILYFQNVIIQSPKRFTFGKGKLLWKYVTTPPLASNLGHFQFEALCVSNHTACRFAEKTRFFRSLLAGRRCAAASRFSFFKVETLYIKNDKARKMSRHFPGLFIQAIIQRKTRAFQTENAKKSPSGCPACLNRKPGDVHQGKTSTVPERHINPNKARWGKDGGPGGRGKLSNES